jgi:hypothetical protein
MKSKKKRKKRVQVFLGLQRWLPIQEWKCLDTLDNASSSIVVDNSLSTR